MMSDAQILTITFTMLAIFVASWFKNSRFGDTNTRIGDVNNRIGDVSKRIDDLSLQLDTRLERLSRCDTSRNAFGVRPHS